MDILSSSVKENPLSIKYVKILKSFLWTIGAWPGEVLGEKLPLIIRYHRKHLPVQTTIILIGEIYYLVKNFKLINFFVMGHMYITSFLSVLTIVRCSLASFKNYGIISKRFLMSFHLIHFKQKGDYYEKMYTIVDKISYYFTLYLMAMMVAGMILFNVSPMYNNFKMGAMTNQLQENSTLEFSIYYIYPGFNPVDHFLVITMYNCYLSFCCSVSICSIDLFLSLMVFQIIGHIQILRNNLKVLPKPKRQITIEELKKKESDIQAAAELFDDEENNSIHKIITECVDHHRMIISFTDDISEFFGPTLAIYYLFHLVSGCLLLLECSRGDPNALARYGPLTIIIFGQLIQISIIFEIVGYVSEKLIDSVYCVPWESMNIRNQRSMQIMLNRVQTPIQVTAMGLTPVGVQTMAGILKTTFSYYTFLRSMNE